MPIAINSNSRLYFILRLLNDIANESPYTLPVRVYLIADAVDLLDPQIEEGAVAVGDYGVGIADRHTTDGLIWQDDAVWGGMKWDWGTRNRANNKASRALKGG